MVTPITKILVNDLLERHSDIRYSRNHGFVAHEKSRNDTHVIVGYSYRYLSSAETVIYRYSIPISEWDNPKLFPTIPQYIKSGPKALHAMNEGYWLHNINYCLSTGGFFIEDIIDCMSTSKERKHRKNSPYKECDVEPNYDDWGNDYWMEEDFPEHYTEEENY